MDSRIFQQRIFKMSSYNILNPFSEKVKQIQASLVASNLLCEISLDGTKLYEENIMLIESKTNLTRLEIKEQFQEFITFCPSGSFSKERLVRILKTVLLLRKSYTGYSNCLILTNQDSSS